MTKQIAIKVSNLSKKYTIGKQKEASFRDTLATFFSKNKLAETSFWALQNVSFEIKKGDVVGIIGKNGAGKSTLLKLLSQITKPTEGKIEINGRIASLLEVGTGFHPELTGRENIYLNGTILGMTRKEVKAKFDEIVAFSGVEKFIDTPVKHYSSGMYVRLAFAVAAHLEPEILIIDEVLAVGDAEFQKKCLGKMKEVAGEGRTVIFVSHDLGAIKNICSNGIYFDKGKLISEGDIDTLVDQYLSSNSSMILKSLIKNGFFDVNNNVSKKKKDFGILTAEIFCENRQTNTLITGKKVEFKFNYSLPNVFSEPVIGLVIKDLEGNPIFGINNRNTGDRLNNKNNNDSISIIFQEFRLIKAKTYSVDIYFGNKEDNVDTIIDAFYFNVISLKTPYKPIQESLNYFYDSKINFI